MSKQKCRQRTLSGYFSGSSNTTDSDTGQISHTAGDRAAAEPAAEADAEVSTTNAGESPSAEIIESDNKDADKPSAVKKSKYDHVFQSRGC